MPGLENLALIPGCAGSSPIQNIGATALNYRRFAEYVDCIELATGVNSVFPLLNAALAIGQYF
jgi:UDP-N-acetylmuramate dehydrogenase